MKSFIVATLGVVFSTGAFATSIMPPSPVSPVLKKINVTKIGTVGSILKRSNTFPVENFVVGIPVSFTTDACTKFVGVQEVATGRTGQARIVAPPKSIELFGTYSPLVDACIQIAVLGNTVVPVTLTVNNYSVPPQPARKLIALNGRSLLVAVDAANGTVSVQQVRTMH